MRARVLLSLLALSASVSAQGQAGDASPQVVARWKAGDTLVQREIEKWDEPLPANDPLEVYNRQFRDAVAKRSVKPASYGELSAALTRENLVLVGDIHTSARSQANAVRVLRAMSAPGQAPPALVIEWIDSKHQSVIDDYLAGKTTLELLRKDVQYERNWPFSWADYSPMLVAAREAGARVLAAETDRTQHELGDRDASITRTIAEDHQRNPAARYLVVYGESHLLGPGHLAERLTARGLGTPFVIVQSLGPDAYWRALEHAGDRSKLATLKLGERFFFLDSGTPLESDFEYLRSLARLAGDEPRVLKLGERLGIGPSDLDHCASTLLRP